ncbi:unnamed protein product [Phytophthora fragariaefolia]|uniref:Unnamed protein product n=1 Tax=Phytophthora fragariaefolia TaxID=1490495 RepID=A0A9W6XP28_9STRA|nr:unnamed protein product [Phytophthora fragariaefolia]
MTTSTAVNVTSASEMARVGHEMPASMSRSLRPRRNNASASSQDVSAGTDAQQGQLPSSTGTMENSTTTMSRSQGQGQSRGRGRGRSGRGGRTTIPSRRPAHQQRELPSNQVARQTGAATNGISVGSHPTVPQPIFTFVTAPKVTDISHDGMTRWLDLRLEYEEAIKARCKTTGEEVEAVMTSVRNSFDESLLDTLCEVVWVVEKSELTEQFLWDWVMKTVESFKNRTLPDIEELFKRELSMDNTQGDVEAQVTNYFHSCNTLIRTNVLAQLFKTENGMKKKCKILVNALPFKLKVKNEINFRAQEAKSSVPALVNLIMEKALDQEKIDQAMTIAGNGRKQNNGEGGNYGKNKPFTPRKIQYRGNNSSTDRGRHGDRRQVELSDARPTDRSSNHQGCFNCGGGHLRRDCPRVERNSNTTAHDTSHRRLVGGRILSVSEVVYLRLSLRTAAGPVNIHSSVECLILDGHDEFLLGRDVLSMLGIDIGRQLELLAWSDGTDDDDI